MRRILCATTVLALLTLPAAVAAADPTPLPGAKFAAHTPVRLLDTRDAHRPLGPGEHRKLVIPPELQASGITAVVLNLTGVAPTQDTYLTAQPVPSAGAPTVSSLNLVRGETRANQVTVPVNSDGSIDLYNHRGSVNLVADFAGMYRFTYTDEAYRYAPVTPRRLLDTRDGGHIASGHTVSVPLGAAVPADATAVTVNLTGIAPTNPTYLTLYPGGQARPLASSVSIEPGETTPNQVTVPVDPQSRELLLYNNFGVTDATVDLVGYYGPTGTAGFHSVNPPRRIADTRAHGGPLGPNTDRSIPSTVAAGDHPVAVVVNLTGVHTGDPTFVTAWASGTARPFTSNLNLNGWQTASNASTPPLGADGNFRVYNAFGSTDILADLQGYFTAE